VSFIVNVLIIFSPIIALGIFAMIVGAWQSYNARRHILRNARGRKVTRRFEP
jgi:hypothetical protein